jgi:hypothetical protein
VQRKGRKPKARVSYNMIRNFASNMSCHQWLSKHVPATAGLRAACWIVPEKSPTTLVSIMESKGEHSHTPMAGTANLKICWTDGTTLSSPSPSSAVAIEEASCTALEEEPFRSSFEEPVGTFDWISPLSFAVVVVESSSTDCVEAHSAVVCRRVDATGLCCGHSFSSDPLP